MVDEEDKKIVEGYAAVFDSPTVLYEYEGIEYKEKISRGAFDGADMKDVIFLYDHKGKVLARNSNGTLELRIDDNGLFIRADLGGTDEGRKMYEEIRGGYVDKMSFGFTVREDSYDKQERMRDIKKFKKLYDVSAVSVPAYDSTNISARDFFNTQKELEKKKKKLELLTKL